MRLRSMSKRNLIVLSGTALTLIGVGILFWLGREEVAEQVEAPLLSAEPLVGGEASRWVAVYFGRPDRVGLAREDRIVVVGETLVDRVGACVTELARGSLDGNVDVLPPKTRLRHAYLDPWGTAYLDFTSDILGTRAPGDAEEWLAVAAIVHTVCGNFPEVREVRFLVDGQLVVSLAGYVDLEDPVRAEDFPLGS